MKSRTKQGPAVELSAEQEAEAQRIYTRIKDKMNEELLGMVRHMASKADHEIFGVGEFELRDKLNEFGAKLLEESANERAKKGGTTVVAVLAVAAAAQSS